MEEKIRISWQEKRKQSSLRQAKLGHLWQKKIGSRYPPMRRLSPNQISLIIKWSFQYQEWVPSNLVIGQRGPMGTSKPFRLLPRPIVFLYKLTLKFYYWKQHLYKAVNVEKSWLSRVSAIRLEWIRFMVLECTPLNSKGEIQTPAQLQTLWYLPARYDTVIITHSL